MPDFSALLPALAFAAHPDPMWVFEWPGPPAQAGRMVDVNRAALAAYGYDRASFLRLGLFDLRCESERAPLTLERASPEASTDGRPALVWHRRRNGERFQVEIRCERLEHDGGSFRLVLARDCSDLRLLQSQEARWRDAARDAERLLYSTFDLVSDGVVLFDAAERYRYFNARAMELVGVTENDDLIGERIWDLFPHRVGSPFHAAFRRVLTTGQPESVEELHPISGLWLELRLYPASDGGLTVLLTDVTPRHREAAELAQRERDWRQLAEQVPAIIYRSRAEEPYDTLWINPRVHDLGYSQEAWLADPGIWARSLHPQDAPRVMNDLLGSLAERGKGEIEYRMRAADGRWHWFRDASRIVHSKDGKQAFIQGVMFDITHLRDSEAALVASRQQMAELANRLLVQEKETTGKLALALHDGIGQTVAVARLYLSAALAEAGSGAQAQADADARLRRDERPAGLAAAAERAEALLARAIGEIRQTLLDLRPPLLDEQGLLAALDNELRSVQPPGGSPQLQLVVARGAEGLRWPPDVEYGGFMVTREALSNAIRHARARTIRVEVQGTARRLCLTVQDDGIGTATALDAGQAGPVEGAAGSLGLTGMRERASAMGARLSLGTAAGGGTRVVLDWSGPTPA